VIDLGTYKTAGSKTFHCHFDPDKQVAVALGPLPDLAIALEVVAQDETEAKEKLKQEIGIGVFAEPVKI
jgi:hypothetical protein